MAKTDLAELLSSWELHLRSRLPQVMWGPGEALEYGGVAGWPNGRGARLCTSEPKERRTRDAACST